MFPYLYGSVLKNTFFHAKALSSFSSPANALRISKITSNSYNIKLQKYNKLLSPSSIRFKNTSASEKELNDNIFVSDELYDALKKRFQDNEDAKINHVRLISQAEIKFLQRGICYNGDNLKQLKETILNNANDKKIWVDRCKELSTELKVCELEAKIPDLLDLFRQIVGSDHYDILINVLRNAFALKTSSVNGKNSDWDIFAFRKTDEGQWHIAILRIEALGINDQWDLYFFKWGKNVIKVDFLGYHLRPFDENTQ